MQAAIQLGQLSGATEIVTDAGALAGYEVGELRPSAAAIPNCAADVAEIIRAAAAQKLAVIPSAGRTKLSIGAPPSRYDVALDFSKMNRVLAYDPRDLTLGVEPGISFAELSTILAAENQFLPLAPPHSERATIGGILAANWASPLRQFYGGPRDFVLGMEFVTGYGAQTKSGGRVVKNVTGYDLHKLLIGSLGTLAAITRVNFKTFPLPPAQATFVAAFADFKSAHGFAASITRSPLEPLAIEIISPETSEILRQGQETARTSSLSVGAWQVLVFAAGNDAVVARHARDLKSLAATAPALNFVQLDAATGEATLARTADFPRIARGTISEAAVLRISALPEKMPALVEQLSAAAQHAQIHSAILVRPYGLIYFALIPQRVDVRTVTQVASAVDNSFRVAAENGARAFIELGSTELKRRTHPWGPEREDFELMRRVKKAFDPENIFSPGRFAGGI